jgi:hypothetical protein
MAFLSKTENKADIEKIDELMGKPIKNELKELLTNQGARNLRKLLKSMAKEGKTPQELEYFFNYTLSKTRYIQDKKAEYIIESKLSDQVYKAYINDGISRIEKVNGRFLASQTIKLDMLIEQNNKIIELLDKIANK